MNWNYKMCMLLWTLIILQLRCSNVLASFSSLQPKFVQPGYHAEPTYEISGPDQNPTNNPPSFLMFYVINSDLQQSIEMYMDNDLSTSFNYSVICTRRDANFMLTLTTPDTNILKVVENYQFPITCKKAVYRSLEQNKAATTDAMPTTNTTKTSEMVYSTDEQIDVKLRSGVLGIGTIEFTLIELDENDQPIQNSISYRNGSDLDVNDETSTPKATPTLTYTVKVFRWIRPVDTIFRIVIYCVQIFVVTGFGAKLDLNIVKENLFRPVAPGIGMACQYIIMPLIAFTVAKAVPMDSSAVALGIFVAGCCPGGGGSNMYSYLLKGDLSLSITMTALSTVAALAMLPLWVYTLGKLFLVEGQAVSIPFEMVAVSLSILIVPLVFGVFLRQKFPNAADKLQKVLKPIIVVMTVILIVIGIYSNLYIFRLFKPRIVLAACLLPYVGYLLGGIVAAIFRQPWKRIKTISIETGMQNTSIAYILLTNSFSAPLGDIAAVAPVASAVMTPLPPFIVTIIYLIYQKCRTKNEDKTKKEGAKSNKEKDGADEKLTEV